MPAALRQRRREAVNDAKRELILAAARSVFEAEGLDGASMRAIADAAGYTAAALYFHFPSKEAVYGAVLAGSLDRLIVAVAAAADAVPTPRRRLSAAALAFYDFYAENPRDLDLGFYLFRGGMRPRGLSKDLDAALNRQLLLALEPVAAAARDLGASKHVAQAATASLFSSAVGLLLMQHTGRMKLFSVRPRALMEAHVAAVVRSMKERP